MAVELRAELDEGLRQLGTLLESGKLADARSLAERLTDQWPESAVARRYALLLGPTEVAVRTGERSRRHEAERVWLRDHAREYPGCWLAVSGGELVAADPELGTVLAHARASVGEENFVLYFEP
jgi:hypothetical protein